MKFPDARILIFCKAPVAGTVKTRIARELGDDAACRLHEALATRMISAAITSELAPVEIWCAPSTDHPFFDSFAAIRRLQEGEDLGARMSAALAKVLAEGADRAVLVGTDCPPIDGEYLEWALRELDSSDAVLGPADDGGYGLIGLTRPCPAAFSGIAWSTPSVAEETLARFAGQKMSVSLLDQIWDVDERADIDRLHAFTARPVKDR